MKSVYLFIAAYLSGTGLAIPRTNHVIHESTSHARNGWTKRDRMDRAHTLSMSVALKQSNTEKIYDMLMDVSDPKSSNYGKYYNMDQLVEIFAPSEESHQKVASWLKSAGINPETMKLEKRTGEVKFEASVTQAEKLLRTKYHHFEHRSGDQQYGCEEYHLPEDVSNHVDFITPTVHLATRSTKLASKPLHERPKPKPEVVLSSEAIQAADAAFCALEMSPSCLQQLYGMPTTALNTNQSLLSVVEFSPNAYRSADLETFFTEYSPNQIYKKPLLVSINGGVAPQEDSSFGNAGESDLDLEFTMTLVNGMPVTLYQVGDNINGGSFNTFLNAVDMSYCGGDDEETDPIYPSKAKEGFQEASQCGTAPLVPVISISYGYDEKSLGRAYTERQCNEFGKLGLAGTTVLYSSGDNGVAGADGSCLVGDFGFNPSYASSCPYVTSVGGTQIIPDTLAAEEVMRQKAFSGGGFSNYFPMPLYQADAVNQYFANHDPGYTFNIYNMSRQARGYPDLSANGMNYPVVVAGEKHLGYGTSASTPVVASMFALINQRRKDKGMPMIGFVNPVLYGHPDAFRDVTQGNNGGCGTDGFAAVPGWDPVSGLGVPDFEKMSALFV